MQDRPMRTAPAWSVIVPFFNEERFLGATLRSIAAQSERRRQVILVDNGSTDGSATIARAFRDAARDFEVTLLDEERPGKASALKRGIAAARAPLTAVCDADTFYPQSYLETAERIFTEGGPEIVAALAFGVSGKQGAAHVLARAKGVAAAFAMPRQTHSGGYGQSFRTEALIAVGGFSPEIWPYCLMDHEVMNRLVKHGRIGYDYSHWCAPSPRRRNRSRVRWTLAERLLYHVVPHERKDWFFYEYLKPRFEKRGLGELNLRRKEWSHHSG